MNFTTRRLSSRRCRRVRGFTLIEMLVSLAITLIMMGAVVTLFGVISESVSNSRSLIEMSDRLRAAREVLQQDLQGATAPLTPPLSPENDQGYFEIIEGQFHDGSSIPANMLQLFGDTDDILMFTTRSRSGPFLGKYTPSVGNTRIIESPVAEVVYFLVQDGPLIDSSVVDAAGNPVGRLCTLYRRVFLVSPSVGNYTGFANDFYDGNDVSVRFLDIAPPTLAPNTLGDLTKRENRFAHYGVTSYLQFPFMVDLTMSPQYPFAIVPATGATIPKPDRSKFTGTAFPAGRPDANAFIAPLVGSRLGEDVLLTNVLAFDVRVWDPTAPLVDRSGVVVEPRDPQWVAPTGFNPQVASGTYVDLGYYNSGGTPISVFEKVNPDQKPTGSFATGIGNPRVYDTWSLHYENDGLDQDTANGVDGATNGLDDDGDGLIDERDLLNPGSSEYDTHPPYAAPVRGIEITIRTYEPSSKQVREAVVVQNFDTK